MFQQGIINMSETNEKIRSLTKEINTNNKTQLMVSTESSEEEESVNLEIKQQNNLKNR